MVAPHSPSDLHLPSQLPLQNKCGQTRWRACSQTNGFEARTAVAFVSHVCGRPNVLVCGLVLLFKRATIYSKVSDLIDVEMKTSGSFNGQGI